MVVAPGGTQAAPGGAPAPRLKDAGRLRSVHYVYELPDSHPLLAEMAPRVPNDPCPYLLAIWGPGESSSGGDGPQSAATGAAEGASPTQQDGGGWRPADSAAASLTESVKGTLLIPCRTAMRGRFPLNGTYFQVNEVFADHATSHRPVEAPRVSLWSLCRRLVYFGTSTTTIFRGMSTSEIHEAFWSGYVCVRGFDRASRAPRPLVPHLHMNAAAFRRKQPGRGGREAPLPTPGAQRAGMGAPNGNGLQA